MGGSSSATSRLQLQSLKAAAQKLGLGNGSMGMSMIDTIYEKGQAGRGKADSSEWAEVLKLIAGGKVGFGCLRFGKLALMLGCALTANDISVIFADHTTDYT